MRCPYCTETNTAHTVDQIGKEQHPGTPYFAHWDVDDDLHVHNENVYTSEMKCSNGHTFIYTKPTIPCPSGEKCGWTGPYPPSGSGGLTITA